MVKMIALLKEVGAGVFQAQYEVQPSQDPSFVVHTDKRTFRSEIEVVNWVKKIASDYGVMDDSLVIKWIDE